MVLPRFNFPIASRLEKGLKIGLIADLHHDIVPDGMDRLKAFAKAMKRQAPDATIQLGDFALPNARNQELIRLFNQTSGQALHVIGNHDLDLGHTKQQCLEVWGMPHSYYARNIGGLLLLVLDGNQQGSPGYKGGYPSFVGPEQRSWLKDQLAGATQPVIVVSHQPLAGPIAVDDALEVQQILSEYPEKILLAINGHSHIDYLLRIRNVAYLHINSAAYYWVGEGFRHRNYPEDVVAKYPLTPLTCPYRDSLFATLSIDAETLSVAIQGIKSEWVGPSPAQLGQDAYPGVLNGEEIAPHIRGRFIERVKAKTG